MLQPSRFAGLAPRYARTTAGATLALTLACLIGSFLWPAPARKDAIKDQEKSPDLEAYRQIVERVREGENYYDAAGDVLPRLGFSTGAVFNWRLPTYAWVLSWFPSPVWIQVTLAALAIVGMLMAYGGERRDLPPGLGAVTVLLLAGVAKWIVDGEAYYAQELWAAFFLLLSVAAYGIGRRWLAVLAALIGLAFRELVLPYCLIALALALWRRRWAESAGWLLGILLFFVYLAWHASQVRQQPAAASASGGVSDWVSFIGLPFVLITIRMNQFLFLLPLPGLALYLCVALFGLIGWRSERGLLLTLTCGAYLASFAILGLPSGANIYWGLLPAPLLCFGPARVPRAVSDLLVSMRRKPASVEA